MFYIVATIAAFFALLFGHTEKTKFEYKLFFFILVFFILIVTCLRKTELFPDTENYKYYFYYGEFLDSWVTTDNVAVLYKVLNNLFNGWSSFQFFCSAIAFFIIVTYSSAIYKWSPYPFLSFFLFILVNYVPSCFIFRQYIAMSFCIIAFRFILSRELVKFVVLVIIASCFHITALVTVPLYFLFGISPERKKLIGIVIGVVLFSLILEVVLSRYAPGVIGDYYSHYLENEGSGSFSRLIMKIFICICLIISTRGSFNDKNLYLLFLLMLMNVSVCIAGLSIPSFFRLREYFSIADIVGIPLILSVNKNNHGIRKWLVSFMVVFYIILLFISFNNFITDDHMEIQYDFFWR